MRSRRAAGAARALLAAAALSACAPRPGPPASPPSRVGTGATGLTSAEEVTVSEYDGARLRSRLRADRLVVVPKRIGVFELAAEEVVISRPRLELFETASLPGEPVRAPTLAGPLRSAARARLSTVVSVALLGVELDVVRDGREITRVRAERGSVDAGSGDLVLHGFALEHLPSGRALHAARAVWRRAQRAFAIRGDYTITDGDRTTAGRGTLVDLELRRADPP